MKYLKLFESEKHYYHINQEEFDENCGMEEETGNFLEVDNWDIFTEAEKKTISDLIGDEYFANFINPFKHDKPWYLHEDESVELLQVCDRQSVVEEKDDWTGTLFYVIKCKDEWFYVCEWKDTYGSNFYKCDQMFGVIEYINDYFSKHTKRHWLK
jgi:hypothetical protein